jgi:hypothetical protein
MARGDHSNPAQPPMILVDTMPGRAVYDRFSASKNGSAFCGYLMFFSDFYFVPGWVFCTLIEASEPSGHLESLKMVQ